jgi:CelD/BcsL family acetyltransferase involved in cellulose biosynthesis
MIAVELVDNGARFAALEGEWNEVVAASRLASVFVTHEWLNAWWTHLRGSRRLAILAVRDQDELIGVAPLSITHGRLPLWSRCEFLGTGLAGSDYLDIVAKDGRETDVARAATRFMQANKPTLHLDHLPAHSLAARLVLPLVESGWTARQKRHGVCPLVALNDGSWEGFLGRLATSHRATVRRRLNGLARKFDLKFSEVTEDGQRRDTLNTLFAFHDARWGTRGGSTAFASRELRAFHHDATRRLLVAGWLRLYALRLNDDLAAVMYGFAFKRRFYFYQHGFDAKFHQHSVGRALVELSIKAAIAEGCTEFDMLYGDEAYKSFWATGKRDLDRIDLFPAHLGGRLQQHAAEAERTLRTVARRVVSLYPHSHATQAS